MSDYLPRDVVIDILTKLPLKSLVRCTCVCKSWYSLITSPTFISTHISSKNPAKNDGYLLIRHYSMFSKEERYALHDDNESFACKIELKCPLDSQNEYFRVVGSCNGLICLSDDYDSYKDTVVLWNPLMNNKFLRLPPPNFAYNGRGSCVYGFGFDDLIGDFKVVRIVYNSNATEDKFDSLASVDFLDKLREIKFTVPPEVEIFRLSSGSWRGICDVAPNYVVCQNHSVSVFVNGAVHWVACNEVDDDGDGEKSRTCDSFVVAFDMRAEVFREIALPDCVAKKSVMKLSVMAMGDSLALIEYQKFWQSDYCWIWLMKEYSVLETWTKLYNIDMRGGIRDVVAFRNNGEILLSARLIGMVSYDPQRKKIKYLGIHGTNRSFRAENYVESLALVKRTNGILSETSSSSAVNSDKISVLLTENGTEDDQ